MFYKCTFLYKILREQWGVRGYIKLKTLTYEKCYYLRM